MLRRVFRILNVLYFHVFLEKKTKLLFKKIKKILIIMQNLTESIFFLNFISCSDCVLYTKYIENFTCLGNWHYCLKMHFKLIRYFECFHLKICLILHTMLHNVTLVKITLCTFTKILWHFHHTALQIDNLIFLVEKYINENKVSIKNIWNIICHIMLYTIHCFSPKHVIILFDFCILKSYFFIIDFSVIFGSYKIQYGTAIFWQRNKGGGENRHTTENRVYLAKV